MRATFDSNTPGQPRQPPDALGLLRGAAREVGAGVAVVARATAGHAILYCNDSFRAITQLGSVEPEDLRLDDVPGLGPTMVELLAQTPSGTRGQRRAAVRLGDTLRAVLLCCEEAPGADGTPVHVVVVHEPDEADGAAHDGRPIENIARAALASGQGHWDWNLVAGTVWYGARFKVLLGYEPNEMEDTFAAFLARVHADDRMRLTQALRLHLEQQQPFDVELRVATATGEYRWFRLAGSATRDQANRPLHLSGHFEDVSERREAIARAQRAEEFLRRTLDASDVPVAVLNAAGEIVEINRAWREFASDRALVGLRYGFGESYVRLARAAHERCAAGPEAAEGVERLLRGDVDSFRLDYQVDDAAGGHAFRLRARAFLADSGRGVIVRHEDTSEIAAAHAAAARTRQFYELILDSIPLHVAYVNRSREFIYANRSYEEWFQLPLAALQGLRLEQVTSPDNYRRIAPRVDAVLSGHQVDFVSRATRGDEQRELAVAYIPHTVAGETEGFFAVARDVTAQRRLETELRHAQKMEAIGQLTGGIAHDFNNLLSVVIGNLQLLERSPPAEPRQAANVSTALRAALRGADLTRRLLAFARQQVLEPRVIAPDRLLAGMRELVARTLGRTIQVVFDLDAATWPVFVDAGQLESSVLNLAINARDAMPDGGQLTIAARNRSYAEDDPARHPKLPAGDYVEVVVRDTGSGMPPEVAKRAFEPFFTTKAIGKGTGLGLSMVYGFTEQSGGLATIASEAGAGTAVSLYFPRSTLPGAPGHDADGAAGDLPRGTETVLVVDDDADVRATAAAALHVLGYRVLEAGEAGAALAVLEREPEVRLLLCDVLLPGGMLGPELAVRARELRPQLRVLHTSGFMGAAPRPHGPQPSAEVLNKPYAIGDLARRVRAVLDEEKSDAE